MKFDQGLENKKFATKCEPLELAHVSAYSLLRSVKMGCIRNTRYSGRGYKQGIHKLFSAYAQLILSD